MFGWFKRDQPETRATGTGSNYAAQLIGSRAEYMTGRSGVAELTSTVQSCVSLWEGCLAVANVNGTDLLTKRALALAGRSLALRGEAVFLVGNDGLVACSDWDLSTRFGAPKAYRLSIPDVGGGTSRTALAAEVLHFRIGADASFPYSGQAPLRRSGLTAQLLHEVESALTDAYRDMPLGSQVVPYPEAPDTDMAAIARGFRGYRGGVQVRESVNVTAAGAAAPAVDWKPHDLTPNLQPAMFPQALDAARGSVAMAFGVLPALLNVNAVGTLVREAQRHLAQFTVAPMAQLMAEEASEKLGGEIFLDVETPLQAFDSGARSRALKTVIEAMALAKEQGVDAGVALKLVDWQEAAND